MLCARQIHLPTSHTRTLSSSSVVFGFSAWICSCAKVPPSIIGAPPSQLSRCTSQDADHQACCCGRLEHGPRENCNADFLHNRPISQRICVYLSALFFKFISSFCGSDLMSCAPWHFFPAALSLSLSLPLSLSLSHTHTHSHSLTLGS